MSDWPIPPFINHDAELAELVEAFDLAETILGAALFDDLDGPLVPITVRVWSRFWCHLLHTRLGDARTPPRHMVSSRDLSRYERKSLVAVFEQIAGVRAAPSRA